MGKEETIQELEEHGYNIRRNGVSNYTIMKNSRIVFIGKIPDHTDDIKSTTFLYPNAFVLP